MRGLVAVMMLVSGMPAMAADGPWTPAPVPSVSDPHVQPAARAGSDTSGSVDTPFSATPQGSVAANGATTSNTVSGAQTPDLTGK